MEFFDLASRLTINNHLDVILDCNLLIYYYLLVYKGYFNKDRFHVIFSFLLLIIIVILEQKHLDNHEFISNLSCEVLLENH